MPGFARISFGAHTTTTLTRRFEMAAQYSEEGYDYDVFIKFWTFVRVRFLDSLCMWVRACVCVFIAAAVTLLLIK